MSDTEDKTAGLPGPRESDMLAASDGGFTVIPGPNGGLPTRHPRISDYRPVLIVKKKNGRYVRQYDENVRPPNANSRYIYYVQTPVIVTAEQLKALMHASCATATLSAEEKELAGKKMNVVDASKVRWFTTDRHAYTLAVEAGANMTGNKNAAATSSSSSQVLSESVDDDVSQIAVVALLHDPTNLFYIGRRVLPPLPNVVTEVTKDADGNDVLKVTDDAKACLVITVAEMYLKSKVHKARMMRCCVSAIQRVLASDNVWCSGSNKIEVRGKMPSAEQINMLSILPGIGNVRVALPPTPEEAAKGLTTPSSGDLIAEGAGGLPVMHDQNVLCLMSGGLDSPVAAYQMMVRGCTVAGVHYLNSTSETSSVLDKNRLIAKRLSVIQGSFEMRFVDISRLQAEIVARIRPLNRTLLYKWYMLYISGILDAKAQATTNVVAVSNSRKALGAAGKPPASPDHRHKNLLLVVGDSVGQVASQTPQNIYSLYSMQAMAAAAVCIERVGTMRGGDDDSDDSDESDAEGGAIDDDNKPKKKKSKLPPHIGLDGEEVPRSAKTTTLDRAFKDMIFKPVIAPLVGSNKMDIVDTARKIGTYELSILPGGDCCQYMMCKVGANLGIGRKVLKGSVKVIPHLTLPIVAETYRNGELECTHEEVLELVPPFRSEEHFKGINILKGDLSPSSSSTAPKKKATVHVNPTIEDNDEEEDGPINFDVAAGGDMCSEAAHAFVNAPKGNPNSLHRTGREARMAVEKVRSDLANKLNSGLAGNWVNDIASGPLGAKNGFKSADILFTSGGTESNNIALNGCHVIRDNWSHPSTKGNSIEEQQLVGADGKTKQVVQVYDLVHHETGCVRTSFPKNPEADRIHVDACQALCKIDLSKIDLTNVSSISFSSHKINGPQGVGILYVRDAEKRMKEGVIQPLAFGGTQEHSIRPGTENVQGIMGFGAALNINRRQATGAFRQVEELLSNGLVKLGCVVNRVPDVPTSGYIIHATLPPQLTGMNVSFVSYLSTVYGVEIGTGSACKSGSSEENTATFDHLVALGVDVGGTLEAPIPTKRAIRLSYDYTVTVAKAERALRAIGDSINHFKKTQSPVADGNAGVRVSKH